MNKQFSLRKTLTASAIASVFAMGLAPATVLASEADIMKKIEALQAEINSLKNEAAATKAARADVAATPAAKSAAKGSLEWYGLIDMGMESNDDGTTNRSVMQSFSSRIGFRGQRTLSGSLEGIMQVETKIAPDSSDNSKLFASRNSYVGLRDSFGSLIWGTYDTPLKSMNSGAKFLEGNADTMEHIIHGKANYTTIKANFHTRPMNIVQYWSPDFAGLSFKAAYSTDEAKDVLPPDVIDKQLRDDTSFSLMYNGGWWNVGLATDSKTVSFVKTTVAVSGTKVNTTYVDSQEEFAATKLIGGMKFNNLKVGAAYSTVENDTKNIKANNWMVSAEYTFSPFVFKANYGVAGDTKTAGVTSDDGGKMLGLELDYVWDKQTMFYVYYADYNADLKAKGFKFDAGENSWRTANAGDDASVLGAAVQYKF